MESRIFRYHIILLLAVQLVDAVLSVHIVFGTPGGGFGVGMAGLYGGRYESGKNASDFDFSETKIYRANYGSTSHYGISVTGLSYDHVSKNLLMLTGDSTSSSLVKVDPCINKELEEKDFYFYEAYDLQTGPFALYNSEIYFVAQETRWLGSSIILELTIRKVTGCQDQRNTFMNRDGSDKRNCSVEIAKVMERNILTLKRKKSESYRHYVAENVRTVGSKLLVLKRNGKLVFFVQIADPLYFANMRARSQIKRYSLDLYEIEEGGEGEVLYSAGVDRSWTNHILNNIGDISFKDGLLCWTAFEEAFCRQWPRTENNRSLVTRMVLKGQAAQVCKVSINHGKYGSVVTGIQVLNADTPEIMFGCWASWMGNGGAGVALPNGRIRPLEDKSGRIFAGNLLAVGDCPSQ